MSALGDGAAVLVALTPLAKLVYEVASGEKKTRADIAGAALNAAADLLRDDLTIEAEARAEMAFMAAKLAKRIAGV